MKHILIFTALLMLAQAVTAVEVNNLSITIEVDSLGDARIVESYELQFVSPFEESEFNQSAIENSSSIQAWMTDYDFFEPHFVSGLQQIASSSITYDQELKKIIFEYTPRSRFSRLVAQEQRADSFVIDDKQLSFFTQSGTVVIPENVLLQIRLPLGAELDTENLPEKAVVNGNSVLLRGLQTNSLSISYRIIKPIAPTSNDLIEGISNIYLIVVPLTILVIAGVYVKRREIEEKIEDYIVEHSQIKTRESEEELDFDLD